MQKRQQVKTSAAKREARHMSVTGDSKPANQADAARARQSQTRSGAPDGDQAGVGNVDKIREILFGSQMREIEARMARLEQSLAETTGELRQSTSRRLDTLERHFTKELETLEARQKAEREERAEAVKKLAQESKQADEALAKKAELVSDQGIAAQRELRAEILKQSKDLRDEIGRVQAELSAALEQRFQELGNAKTDRAALAAILTEVAMRISDDLHLPVAEG